MIEIRTVSMWLLQWMGLNMLMGIIILSFTRFFKFFRDNLIKGDPKEPQTILEKIGWYYGYFWGYTIFLPLRLLIKYYVETLELKKKEAKK